LHYNRVPVTRDTMETIFRQFSSHAGVAVTIASDIRAIYLVI
jgi:hypothetical protein